MKTNNLEFLCTTMRSVGATEAFLQGALFMLGGVLMRNDGKTPLDKIATAQQWVVPHDIQAIGEDILGRMYDGRIAKLLEEFFYRMDIEIPVRTIASGNWVSNVLTPADHGLLTEVDFSKGRMKDVSDLYFEVTEKIGNCLKDSEYTDAEAYFAGICLFSSWAQGDIRAVTFIINTLGQLAPPVLKYFFALPTTLGFNGQTYTPTQIALWGFVTGLDDDFMSLAWPFQSFLLFNSAKVPFPGLEDLSPDEFYLHCYPIAQRFFNQYQEQIAAIAHLEVGPDYVPNFTGTGEEQEAVFALIKDVWGYDVRDKTLARIDQKQTNACIIFAIFCSMCRACRIEDSLAGEGDEHNEDRNNDEFLKPVSRISTLEEFVRLAEIELEAFPRFSVCAVFATNDDQKFNFLALRETYPPEITTKIFEDLILATRASEVFILYFTDLQRFFDEDLGQYQSILFQVNKNGSAPYWFCQMIAEPKTWRIQPFTIMPDHDEKGMVLLSNSNPLFQTQPTGAVQAARENLASWIPNFDWKWSQFDN